MKDNVVTRRIIIELHEKLTKFQFIYTTKMYLLLYVTVHAV